MYYGIPSCRKVLKELVHFLLIELMTPYVKIIISLSLEDLNLLTSISVFYIRTCKFYHSLVTSAVMDHIFIVYS